MARENVEDIATDGDFDVFIDHRGDLGTVVGRDAFEQEVEHRLQEKYISVIGEIDPGNIMDLLENQARRVANEMDRIQSLQSIVVEPDDDIPGVYNVSIVYDTGELFTFDIEE